MRPFLFGLCESALAFQKKRGYFQPPFRQLEISAFLIPVLIYLSCRQKRFGQSVTTPFCSMMLAYRAFSPLEMMQ